MSQIEREQRRAVIRAANVKGRPGVTLKVITPYVVDDYGSVFEPDTFDESLAARMPVLCWSHDWAEPLGPAIDARTGQGGPEIDFAFSDFDAVPMARRAHAQVADGTILDCSVGFSNIVRRLPTKDDEVRWPGVREVITKANLDEVSLVLRGAVPGAKVLSVRRPGSVVTAAAAAIRASRSSMGAPTARPSRPSPVSAAQRMRELDELADEAIDKMIERGFLPPDARHEAGY